MSYIQFGPIHKSLPFEREKYKNRNGHEKWQTSVVKEIEKYWFQKQQNKIV